MILAGKRIGFAMCGSFCTFDTALDCAAEIAKQECELTAILSDITNSTDTRFMTAAHLKERLAEISKRPTISSIVEAEPIGPKKLFDLLLVLPATGNTLAKITAGIADTPVSMAVKSHLRNNRPVILAISTNDALGNNAKNIGHLLNTKNIYFVPFKQDDPTNKPKSIVFLKNQVIPSLEQALQNKQLQPILG